MPFAGAFAVPERGVKRAPSPKPGLRFHQSNEVKNFLRCAICKALGNPTDVHHGTCLSSGVIFSTPSLLVDFTSYVLL